ncbi:sugar ABC transporter [Paraburkholderia flava]|uniref:sugar ABC transporter n=1 Tax=Paraburkholderia flava TaxID=2547393 RepID=UPI003B8352A4
MRMALDEMVANALIALLALAATFAPTFTFAQTQTLTQPQAQTQAQTQAGRPEPLRRNVAFFDGPQPPVALLQAFDAVVLNPSRGFDPSTHPLAHTIWFAKVSKAGTALDPSAFVAQRIEPLWQRGYRGFELDTPDAIASIDAIRAAHPDVQLIVGGADALRAALPHARGLYAVLGPPLVRGFPDGDDGNDPRSVRDVSGADRTARGDAAHAFTSQTGVPVLSIEICPRTDRACARAMAAQVIATGVKPYVTSAARDVVGIGSIEVLPRKVLIVQNRDADQPLDETLGVRNLATPLNYLGYDVEYADLNAPLPADITPDRYAGVVAWIEGADPVDPATWQRWIDARIADHVPVAFMGQFGFDAAEQEGAALDLQPVPGPFAGPVGVVVHDPMMGFEIAPKPDARDLVGIHVGDRSRPLLRLTASGSTVDAAAITPWGGYTLSPHTIVSLNGIGQTRWAIQPIAFMSAALRLVPMPSPSVTTENGRRLFMTHVDGDGYASRAEFPGADYSGDALYQQIFTRYKVPMTLSVIEGEVGPSGLYPKISPRLEALARQMFALPYVQIGSHTYSHPFQMADLDLTTGTRVDRVDRGNGGDTAFSLNIPGYTFNLDREITGSIDYINSRLAPPGKRTEVLQWPGDCEPPAIAVRKAYEAGVQNINGGDTIIRKSANSWTHIAPIGVDKGPGAYQVYAPNQDENVYTNNWLGPFYGFTQVLETYDMTDRPLRFKPIDVYYHMYSGTKIASLRALDQIFSTVLKQPVLPVYITDYTHKVLDWRSFAVAREMIGGAWVVRGNGNVRELHWPRNDAPNLLASSGVTGYAAGPDGTYVHIADGAARVVFPSASGAAYGENTVPYIAEANGFVRHFRRTPGHLDFEFGGYYQPFVKLANAQSCSVQVAGQQVATKRDGAYLRFDTAANPVEPMRYQPVEIYCGR